MFDEEEPGKPKNWACTVAIIAAMMAVNIAIFVVCRFLLDSEDEFNEPILQGKLRDDITTFLGVFSMTFCFGCCCCFCCGGSVFRWIFRCHCGACLDISRVWSSAIRRQNPSRPTSDDEMNDVVVAANSVPTVCTEIALNIHSECSSEYQRAVFSNRAFNGYPDAPDGEKSTDMELKRSIAYAAAAPPAEFCDLRLCKDQRSKSIAF